MGVLSLGLAGLLAGCAVDRIPPPDGGLVDSGMDAATDAGPGLDADAPAETGAVDGASDAATDGPMRDGPPSDGRDEAGRRDGGEGAADGSPDGWVPEGCNPVSGIECDGDWTAMGECGPSGCPDGQCCSPQNGRFTCVPRDAEGRCPAPDLWVDASRIEGNYTVRWEYFSMDHCALVERCVEAPGWRRLLRFDTWTPNTGEADMYLGPPTRYATHFEYSPCHDHYHFNTYARYFLLRRDGTVAARGHKQAFCLLDYYRYPGTDNRGAIYDCGHQGIQRGWQDVYHASLDCQWVDVTDVPPGEYLLRIELNYAHELLERDYSNNAIEVPVTVPPDTGDDDVTRPCPPGTRSGTGRDCGLTRAGAGSCTPGAMVTIACSAACGSGRCSGDPFLRVCAPDRDPACTSRHALASNDDSGCVVGASCGRGGDCCPRVQFVCPEAGGYVVFWGPYSPGAVASCEIAP
ncbi:MAG: lysyl oxidase family protein [Myxococcota bacterium]|nr:lysyl oxidase family protein [Myxococcota bacterium]MDW8363312.1 lysyl oxidase family protein [Myxococcales bacterium]